MNLPTERLVLALGSGIAGAAYLYWTADAVRHGPDPLGGAPVRAGLVLAATVVLALVLRAVARANRRSDSD